MVARDKLTLTLPGVKRPAGRRPTGKAKTAAQRQAAYRERLKAIPQAVYDAAWDAVKQAIRGDSALTIAQARQIYQLEITKARLECAHHTGATPGFRSCSASTTATKSQK